MKILVWQKPGGGAVVSHIAGDVGVQHLRDAGAIDESWVLVADGYMGQVPQAAGLLWDAESQSLVVDRVMADSQTWTQHQAQAQSALDASDITMIRCVEHGVTVPAEWASYRGALRAIVRAASGDPTQPLPSRPAYPAGT